MTSYAYTTPLAESPERSEMQLDSPYKVCPGAPKRVARSNLPVFVALRGAEKPSCARNLTPQLMAVKPVAPPPSP